MPLPETIACRRCEAPLDGPCNHAWPSTEQLFYACERLNRGDSRSDSGGGGGIRTHGGLAPTSVFKSGVRVSAGVRLVIFRARAAGRAAEIVQPVTARIAGVAVR